MTIDINTFCKLNAHLVTFDFEGGDWFAADEVCNALGLNPIDCGRHLTEEDHATITMCGRTDPEDAFQILSEAGLYKLVLQSTSEQAEKFKTWVCEVLVPTLIEDGIYTMQEELLYSPPETHEYRLTYENLWDDKEPSDFNAKALAYELLPTLRRDELVTFNHGAIVGGHDLSSQADLAFSAQRKRQRMRTNL